MEFYINVYIFNYAYPAISSFHAGYKPDEIYSNALANREQLEDLRFSFRRSDSSIRRMPDAK
jgi:hypothetical protein